MTEPKSISETPAAVRAAQMNAQTRGLQTYESHKQQLMQLITQQLAQVTLASTISQSEIAILGAGNCLDLDLAKLSREFGVVHLVDLDPDALELAAENQEHGVVSRIQRHAPIDLAAPLASLSSEDLADEKMVDAACEQLSSLLESMPCPKNDVVVSTCVLSQMIGTLTNVCTEQHPQYLRLLQSLRRGHFRRMLQMLKPGGRGLFVTDLVSSESVPSLKETTESALPGHLAQCLTVGNFFSGLNPAVVLHDFRTCDSLSVYCCDVQIHAPWKWTMGPRVYAVYAISFGLTDSCLKKN